MWLMANRRSLLLSRLPLLLLALLRFREGLAQQQGEKLEHCELHPKIEERIAKDARIWGSKGITEDLVLSVSKFCLTPERITENHCNCHPQRILIENGTVYLNNLIPSHRLGPHEHIGLLVELYEASQVYKLPNVEFTYWLDDHPPGELDLKGPPPGGEGSGPPRTAWPYPPEGGLPPMVAWSKSADNGVLMVPYSGAFRCATDSFDALESQLTQLDSVPWEQRKEVAFGRWNGFCTYYYTWPPGSRGGRLRTDDGRPAPCPRLHLNTLSDSHPQLLDAYDLGRARPVPLAHQNAHKYLVSTDGWSISSKFDKYLLLGSAVLKAASIRDGFYYDAIKAYEHYVPFMVKHQDDVVEAVQWCRAHDPQARHIAAAAQQFARTHLSRPARLCYLFRLLTHLAAQYRYPISCSRRQLCVPLADELRFMQSFDRTNETCNYAEVLDRYAPSDPSDPRVTSRLAELRTLHEDPLHWPRDDLFVEGLRGNGQESGEAEKKQQQQRRLLREAKRTKV